MNLLIKNATVLTNNKDFDVLENALVYIKENRIFYVGKEEQNLEVSKIIDAKNNLVMPGLINAHTHTGMGVFRNYGSDTNLEDWLYKYIFPIEDELEPEDVYYSSLLSMAEMISTGTTSFIDMYFFMDDTARALQKAKMRGIITRGLNSNNIDQRLQEAEDLYNKWHNKENGLIKTALGPHSVYTNEKEDLLKALKLADKLDLAINMHLNESKTEIDNSIKKYKLPPLEFVHSLGFTKHHLIAAHCDWLSEKEKEIAKKYNVCVVHNPVSNLKLASGIMPLAQNLDEGICVSLGTDGVASNNTLDMFEEMKFTSLLSKGTTYNPKAMDAKTTLKMVLDNGAKAMQLENELGKIQEGYLADLIIVDLHNITHTPNIDPVASLIYSTNGGDVLTTIIDGKVIYENKKFVYLDIEDIKQKCNVIMKKIFTKLESKKIKS
ncbi:amidohydrolase [Metamycoplasma hyosynoviae]|uniref:amidohydrolase n=1 Tax=Metamycoplasma hyosynoviae TaxID=29559 RepID=UPI0023670E9B|nr:amidohydrolase [Metamycoplasma hyosynoviae]MDD7884061.1 amidohydrolase [Metamycoplasma hyosynoviae]